MFELLVFAVIFYLNGYIFVNLCGYYGITQIISMGAVNTLFLSILITVLVLSVIVFLLYGFIVTFFGTDEEPPEE